MNFKFPFWTLLLAVLLFFPIAYFDVTWLAIFPAAYLLFAFIVVSINSIKRTFFKKDDLQDK